MEFAVAMGLAKQTLLSVALVLAVGVVCGFLARLIRLPDIVIFLLAGMLLGPGASGLISIGSGSVMNLIVLLFGACYILFDGGASMKLSVLRKVWLSVVLLSTLGVLVTAAVVAAAAQYMFDLPLSVSVLLGATIASTDPSVILPLFRQLGVGERLAQTVIAESAFNDAIAAILTVSLLSASAAKQEFPLLGMMTLFLQEAVFGIGTGLVLGYAAAWLIEHEHFALLAEYTPTVTLIAVIGTYLIADGLHGSGFMAAFAGGIVMGNRSVLGFRPRKSESQTFDEFIVTTSLIMRMFIFILLGSQIDTGVMLKHAWGSIAVVSALIVVARPLAVMLCTCPDKKAGWSFKELVLISWTRETGVIPAALAGVLTAMRVEGAEIISAVTFMTILITVLLQASTTRTVALRLGLTGQN